MFPWGKDERRQRQVDRYYLARRGYHQKKNCFGQCGTRMDELDSPQVEDKTLSLMLHGRKGRRDHQRQQRTMTKYDDKVQQKGKGPLTGCFPRSRSRPRWRSLPTSLPPGAPSAHPPSPRSEEHNGSSRGNERAPAAARRVRTVTHREESEEIFSFAAATKSRGRTNMRRQAQINGMKMTNRV